MTAEDIRPEPAAFLVSLRAVLPSLAPAEQRVGGAVLADPAAAAARTITELARACGTSETTIVRFCRSLGLQGYPALRLSLAAAVGQEAGKARFAGGDIDPTDDLETVISKIGYADSRAIEETVSSIDRARLREATEVMGGARRIDIYGVGASGFVALDLQQKLQRIGLPAFAWPDPHAAVTSAALLAEGDVALGISHTGSTLDTVDSLIEAGRSGATTVALTNFPRSRLAEVASILLTTAARETTYRSGAMASRIAQLTVVDCLFVLLAQRDFDRSRLALERTYAAVGRRRGAGSRATGV